MPPRQVVHAHLTAIATMCAGVFLLVLYDTISKWLVVRYEPLQVLFLRSVFALPLVAALVWGFAGIAALRTSSLPVHAVRGLLTVVGSATFISSLKHLSLAAATSLAFVAPLFVDILSGPLLGEKVGRRRWLAVVVAFAGVLVIVRPGTETFQPAALLAVAAAFIYALIEISVRWVDARERVWTMMFYITLFTGAFSAPVVAFQPWPELTSQDVLLFAGSAVFGTIGLTLVSQAFRMAPAGMVAPFDYTALVWASLLGWWVWGDLPAVWTYVGAAAIIAAGVNIILSESKTGT